MKVAHHFRTNVLDSVTSQINKAISYSQLFKPFTSFIDHIWI